MSTNKSLKNYIPTRQVCKPDLIRIARALGLKASEKEQSRILVERCINAAQRLRRDFELSQQKPRLAPEEPTPTVFIVPEGSWQEP